jgi:folate-binding protein YgfZ
MAILTDAIAAEYEALRRRSGVVDRSERGKLLLTGAEAKDFLHGQVTNDVLALAPGTGCYAAFLTHKGKMLGDLRVLDGGDAGLWLDTERAALQELFNMIRRFKLGRDVEVEKRTLQRALLSVAGPRARDVVPGADALPDREHAHVRGEIAGAAVRLVVTDAGVDVICDAERTEDVRGALVRLGAAPVSEAAAEIVRVESGRPRFGADLAPDRVIPQEAGLNERAVSFEKGCYVGQETVARLHWRGKPNRHLRGLRLSAPADAGTALRLGEREVGTVTSPVVSPALGPIALALVRREAEPGAVLEGPDGLTATVEALPFPMYHS